VLWNLLEHSSQVQVHHEEVCACVCVHVCVCHACVCVSRMCVCHACVCARVRVCVSVSVCVSQCSRQKACRQWRKIVFTYVHENYLEQIQFSVLQVAQQLSSLECISTLTCSSNTSGMWFDVLPPPSTLCQHSTAGIP